MVNIFDGFTKALYSVWPQTVNSYRVEDMTIVCLDCSGKHEDAPFFVAGVIVDF